MAYILLEHLHYWFVFQRGGTHVRNNFAVVEAPESWGLTRAGSGFVSLIEAMIPQGSRSGRQCSVLSVPCRTGGGFPVVGVISLCCQVSICVVQDPEKGH